MANYKKYSQVQCGKLMKHYERAKGEDGNYIKFKNQDIDTTKSHLNYNLAPQKDKAQYAIMKDRMDEVRTFNRKDVKVMSSWVVTMPKDFPSENQEEFFQATYDYLENQYGKENVISAYVHVDENSPHLHFSFVPVVIDKKRNDLKVSAKECVTLFDLKTFHPELSHHLKSHFGFEVKILNDATRDGNKSIETLKRKSAVDTLSEIKQAISDAKKRSLDFHDAKGVEMAKTLEKLTIKIDDATVLLESTDTQYKILVADSKALLENIDTEYEVKKSYIKECNEGSELSMMYPNYVEKTEKKKGVFTKEVDEFVVVPKDKWESKHVASNEIHAVRRQQKELEHKMHKPLTDEGLYSSLYEENQQLKQINQEFSKRAKTDKKLLDRVERFFDKVPNALKEFKDFEIKAKPVQAKVKPPTISQ